MHEDLPDFSESTKRRIASGEIPEPMWVPLGSHAALSSPVQDILDMPEGDPRLEVLREQASASEARRKQAAERIAHRRHRRLES